jgi:hypothetical protein
MGEMGFLGLVDARQHSRNSILLLGIDWSGRKKREKEKILLKAVLLFLLSHNILGLQVGVYMSIRHNCGREIAQEGCIFSTDKSCCKLSSYNKKISLSLLAVFCFVPNCN